MIKTTYPHNARFTAWSVPVWACGNVNITPLTLGYRRRSCRDGGRSPTGVTSMIISTYPHLRTVWRPVCPVWACGNEDMSLRCPHGEIKAVTQRNRGECLRDG
jgi:hypothetical protein